MKKDLDSYILTRQELLIMKAIWKQRSATVRDVCNVISQKKATAYTTILTLMQILEKKGALIRKRVGRSYIYSPLISQRQATRNQVNDLLVRFFDGNPNKLIETVLENELQSSEPINSTAAMKRSNIENN